MKELVLKTLETTKKFLVQCPIPPRVVKVIIDRTHKIRLECCNDTVLSWIFKSLCADSSHLALPGEPQVSL